MFFTIYVVIIPTLQQYFPWHFCNVCLKNCVVYNFSCKFDSLPCNLHHFTLVTPTKNIAISTSKKKEENLCLSLMIVTTYTYIIQRNLSPCAKSPDGHCDYYFVAQTSYKKYHIFCGFNIRIHDKLFSQNECTLQAALQFQ